LPSRPSCRARPVFHQQRDSIQDHLTIGFTALALSRYLQELSGVSIKKLMTTLRSVRSTTVMVNGERLTLDPEIPRRPASCSPRSDTKGTKPSGTTQVKVGICGEHGGDPDSIYFFESIVLDYVSCLPFRVPVARLESGRARVATERK
jgi:hypothetical protein